MGVCNIHKPLVGLHKDQPTELSCVCFVHSTVFFVCHVFSSIIGHRCCRE